ncbi:chloride channel protein [Streptococcus saliviloxodontae]|uniref:H+/Cl- antiporter ClcA n=1 Tax=Streptococcus saliviloxodontae TaxID=1349416 RepID=A0ABS2PLX1_9STRE|nr:chloride channel protein [Streptococcus saliviloxodontae]MBM7636267.1 H+/Cl- antiporter ClcA [Streptococcus saliviloxodontae]
MKGIKEEKGVPLLHQVFLCLIGIILGVLVGGIDTVFGRTLLFLSSLRSSNPFYWIPFLGFAGLLITFLYRRFGGVASKGMGLVFEVSQDHSEKIPLRLVPLVIVTTWMTHLFGGSAGREGVAVQIGATFGNLFGRYTHFAKYRKLILVMGMAAGFAGLFQTPIAAVLFALEVLVLEQLYLSALVPSLVAAFVAAITSHWLGLEKFSVPLTVQLTLNWKLLVQLVLLGLIFGLVGNLFAFSLSLTKKKFSEWLPNPYYRIVLGGIVLSFIFLVLWQGRYSGLGTNLIEASFGGKEVLSFDWFFKLVLTVLTLSLGFQGGEVTPLFAIGASLGVVLAPVVGLPSDLVSGIGYIAVFSSATNTLLAPIFIGGEVFGFGNVAYFFVAVAVAYSVNRRHSIYGLQVIGEK